MLNQHKNKIQLFLTLNHIDIFLISETHFTSRSHFAIPGYNLSYKIHPDGTAHGGTAILIKSTIAYYELLKYTETEMQATSVKISGQLNDVTIAAVYCPPKHNFKAYQFEKFFHTLGETFIAGGDLNSKRTLWGS